MPENTFNSNENLTDERDSRKILLDEMNISFDRFLSMVERINFKILSLFEIYLVLATLQFTILTYFGKNTLPLMFYFGLAGLFVIICISIVYFTKLILPKIFEHIELFEEERFVSLCNSKSTKLLNDFIYHTRKSYNNNVANYEELCKGLKISILLVIITLLYFVIILAMFFI